MNKDSYEFGDSFYTEADEALAEFDKVEKFRAIIAEAVDEVGLNFVLQTAVEHSGGSILMGEFPEF